MLSHFVVYLKLILYVNNSERIKKLKPCAFSSLHLSAQQFLALFSIVSLYSYKDIWFLICFVVIFTQLFILWSPLCGKILCLQIPLLFVRHEIEFSKWRVLCTQYSLKFQENRPSQKHILHHIIFCIIRLNAQKCTSKEAESRTIFLAWYWY